jgi:hypothetical protein
MNLPGVPDEIKRDQVLSWIRTLGLNPEDISGDGLSISWDAIRCVVMARDSDGEVYVDGDKIATHTVSIKLV